MLSVSSERGGLPGKDASGNRAGISTVILGLFVHALVEGWELESASGVKLNFSP